MLNSDRKVFKNTSVKERIIIPTINHCDQIKHFKTKVALARRKLQQAWEERGETDPLVLKAGAEFDALMNQYQHIKKEQ